MMADKKETTPTQTTTTADTNVGVLLPPDYVPTAEEEYMNPVMLEYFRQKLVKWRDDLIAESAETIHHLQEETHNEPDLNDRASVEVERALELRSRDRGRKLINKINQALNRINDGSYGYCEETDEPIGIARLDARPIATLSIEAQEAHERSEKIHRDD